MELRHLRVFLVLSEELHFGRAAKRLRTAQSAVSQTLRDLEEHIDARLIERTTRSVKLTSAGQELVQYAREALHTIDRGAAAARNAHVHSGRLKLRVLAATATERIPQLLARFRSAHPLTALEISDGTSAQNLAALDNAFCDIALVTRASTRSLTERHEYEALETSRLVLVVPAQHRLARAARVRLRDLAGEPIVSLQHGDEPDVRRLLDLRLREAGALATDIAVSHPRALLALVAAGLGVTVVPELVMRDAGPGVRARPIADLRQHGGVVAVWNRRRLNDAARQFVTLLRASPLARADSSPRTMNR